MKLKTRSVLSNTASAVVALALTAHFVRGQSGSWPAGALGVASSSPGFPLEIRFTDTDMDGMAQTREDLQIMSLVFEKNLKSELGEESLTYKMGIPMLMEGPSTRFIQSSYLEGFGALFELNVNFPLQASARDSDTETPKSAPTSLWEEAKSELFAEAESPTGFTAGQSKSQPARYDSAKVDDLKHQLLICLKEAAHMRALEPNEFVAVVVSGPDVDRVSGSNADGFSFGGSTGGFGGGFAGGFSGGGGLGGGGGGLGGGLGGSDRQGEKTKETDPYASTSQQPPRNQTYYFYSTFHGHPETESVLTLRAKKSDVDALGNREITPEEFNNRVAIHTYKRPR